MGPRWGNSVLSKTPLDALHWRVRFRRTVTYRPSIWILSQLPTCRSELGQPWHPPFPANPPSHLPLFLLLPFALSEQILRFTILLVSRNCQSWNPVSKVFEAFLYTCLSETNKHAGCSSSVYKIFVGTTQTNRYELKRVLRSIISVSYISFILCYSCSKIQLKHKDAPCSETRMISL